MDINHKVFDNAGNGNIINIQLITLDKEQQQVKWPFKLGKFDLVGGVYSQCLVVLRKIPWKPTGIDKNTLSEAKGLMPSARKQVKH